MAVKKWSVFEAQCDRCSAPHEDTQEYLTKADALKAAVSDGWLRQGTNAIYCAACVALAGAA